MKYGKSQCTCPYLYQRNFIMLHVFVIDKHLAQPLTDLLLWNNVKQTIDYRIVISEWSVKNMSMSSFFLFICDLRHYIFNYSHNAFPLSPLYSIEIFCTWVVCEKYVLHVNCLPSCAYRSLISIKILKYLRPKET